MLRGHRRYDHHRWLRYVLGSVLGSLVRSILDPLTSDFGVPAEWTTIVIGLMILVFVVLQRAVMAVGGDKK